jgi:peptidyl-prolyl cis-trans isomerase D
MKASHILISYVGAYGATDSITRTKIGARALADSILEVLKKSSSKFTELATMSDDPSAKTNNGEMDWFADGAMVPEFNQACLDGKVGDLVVTETAFGYHVIRIDDKKEATDKIRIAQIDLPITFSQETFNDVYSEASKFAAANQNFESFDTASIGLNVMKGDFVAKMAKGIGLPDSRKVVKWMYAETTTLGDVSNVYDFGDKVMVAALTDIKPKGIQSLESVKEGIKVLVDRSVKARILKERMSNVTDLSQASEYNAVVDTSMISFATYSLQNYGPEQNFIGRVSNAEPNKLMGPIDGDQAVYFFKVIERGKAPENKNLDYIKQKNANQFNQRVSTSAYNALENSAEIEDFLFYFY